MAGWRSVALDEVEAIPLQPDGILWRPLRHVLDVGVFGINAFLAPDAGDDVVEEHTEEMLDHEEVYVVLSGRATITIDGETLDARAGTLVFVHDPAVKRHARAEAAQTAVLVIGGPRGGVHEPPAWEAERHRAAGDFDAYADELAAAAAGRPDHPGLLYVLASAEALAGRADQALDHLRRAIELRPTLAEAARSNEDLASIRERL